jgi:hypothetical protein
MVSTGKTQEQKENFPKILSKWGINGANSQIYLNGVKISSDHPILRRPFVR